VAIALVALRRLSALARQWQPGIPYHVWTGEEIAALLD
jgi:hypothetical protein